MPIREIIPGPSGTFFTTKAKEGGVPPRQPTIPVEVRFDGSRA